MTVSPAHSGSSHSAPGLTSAIVGAWRLESTLQRLADGTVRPSPLYGPKGVGYLIYSASGYMAAMLADPRRRHWSSEDQPTESELQAIHDHFIAYCGRYEVDEQEGLVVHHLELHVTPNYSENVLTRRASLEGNYLVLRPLERELPPGILEYTLRWCRAERASPPDTGKDDT
jgi:Lipocalin-like domain